MGDDRSDALVILDSHGRPAAFAVIFDRHFPAVHRYLARRVGDAADDIAGEVFRSAFETRSRFDTTCDSAAPWLFGIATNLVSRWYRSAERRHRAYERLLVRGADRGGDALDVVDDRVDANAIARQLGAALDALADGDRDVLLLFAWEGLSYDEVAIALAIPGGTVRSRLFRARRVLRELLDPVGQLFGDPTFKGGHRG